MKKSSKTRILDNKNMQRIILLAVILSGACLAGLISFVTVRGLVLSRFGSGALAAPSIVENQQTPILDEQGNPLPPAQGQQNVVIAPSQHPWDGASRVTVLLLGLDYRDWEAGSEASRSDTMILLTLDPLTKTAGMLSIPRDMWVSIPGFKHGKINTAYYLGDAYKMPGGGPAMAVQTVEQFIGVPINYYAQIDFDAFVRFIDEIGGVKIDVPEKITIDLLGSGSKTKKTLKPGVQVLPGEWALAYARARYTENGDIDRAGRQQQVIMGIRNQILNFEMLPTLITKAPTLYNQLASGINTNLKLDEVIKLALLAKDIKKENIQQGVFGTDTVLFGRSPDNLSILIPIPDKIHVVRDKIFASSSSLGPETPGSAQEQMQAEGARLAILDGTGSPELLTHTADYLRSQGANIAQAGDAGEGYTLTTLVDHTGSPYTLKYLAELMQVNSMRIYSSYDPASPVDVELFIGLDFARENTLP